MKKLHLVLLALAGCGFGWPAAFADIKAGDLPADTVWYLHIDLERMRTGETSKQLYRWFEKEVVVDVIEDTGIDLSAEVNSLTAFGNADNGTVIVIDGPVSKASQDKLLALAALEGPVDPREHKNRDYYFFGKQGGRPKSGSEPFDDLENSSFVSFAIRGKAIITAKEQQMHAMLDNGGKITGGGSHDGALFILSADRSLLQAGVDTNGLADDPDGDSWESNIVRNTKQAALLVAEKSGMIAIDAKLISADPKMTQAIGGIVNGLIGLQAFNSDLDPDIRDLIRNTKIDVTDKILSVSTILSAEMLMSVLKD